MLELNGGGRERDCGISIHLDNNFPTEILKMYVLSYFYIL